VNGSTSQHEFLPFVRRFATVYQRREYGRLFKSLRYRNLQKLKARPVNLTPLLQVLLSGGSVNKTKTLRVFARIRRGFSQSRGLSVR